MMEDSYNSIQKKSIGEFKDRGSKFIAYLVAASSETDFSDRLIEVKSLHPKARHFCTAIRLVNGLERSNDDGEPSGSAGRPILNQLLSHELKNVACVVVRYFGGTKLGVPGLINAYKQATKEAIGSAAVKEYFITRDLEIKFTYAHMGKLLECIKKLDIEVSSKKLDEHPSVMISIRESEFEMMLKRIKARWLGRSVEDLTEDDEFEGLEFVH